MSDGTHTWKRFAAAVRQLDAETAQTGDPAQAASIPWLADLPAQVEALWMRLIWKRWAVAATCVSLAVLGACFLASAPESLSAPVPRISIPPAP
jgi:hypothetical protein